MAMGSYLMGHDLLHNYCRMHYKGKTIEGWGETEYNYSSLVSS